MTNIPNPGDFPTPQGEHQEPKPEKIIEVGEWFNPFEGYDSLPFTTDRETEHSKAIPFNINGVGRFEASTYYRRDHLELGTAKQPVIIMLPDRDDLWPIENLGKLEMSTAKLSVRPLEERYKIDFNSHTIESVPYDVEVRSPNGNTYTASFDSFYNNLGSNSGEWNADDFGENHSNLIAPDTGLVLGKVEMRLVPFNEWGGDAQS